MAKIGEVVRDPSGVEYMRVPEPRRSFDIGHVPARQGGSDHDPAYTPPTETVPIGSWPFPDRKRSDRR